MLEKIKWLDALARVLCPSDTDDIDVGAATDLWR